MLSKAEREQVEETAELTVRRYFDHYLEKTFPDQLRQVVRLHDESRKAHGSIVDKFNKFRWILLGIASVGGFGGGVGISRLVHLISG